MYYLPFILDWKYEWNLFNYFSIHDLHVLILVLQELLIQHDYKLEKSPEETVM